VDARARNFVATAMSDWGEENFLEKLAHSSAKYGVAGLCPEAEILCASAEPGGTGPISAKLSHHLESCPVCSDLRRRLFLFEQSLGFGLDAEAKEAEKRLDSWMKGFLVSQSLNARVPPVESTPKIITYPSAPKPRPFLKMQWALAAAAIVTITVGVVYIRRSIVALTPATEVAQARQDQAAAVPAAPDAHISPEAVSVEPARPETHALRNSLEPKRRKAESPANTETGPASQPEIATATEQPTQSADETAPPVVTETPTVAESEPGSTASTAVRPIVPPARASFSPGSPAPSAAKAGTGCANCMVTATRSAPPPVAPARLQIAAGTRIWISVESTAPQNDGQFRFEGTLLLPVTASNAVLLEKGTSVFGLGTADEKQIVFQITGFVFRGSTYNSTADPGAIALKPAGSGRVVEFQSGKVAEMWLDSLSTFAATAPNLGSNGSAQRAGSSHAAGSAAKTPPAPKSTNPP
jgi:hypothetical protein